MPEEHQSAMPVLLVEDNELDVEMTQRVLGRLATSVRLVVARDGAATLAYCVPHDGTPLRPDLILLDLNLPAVSGLDVLRRLRAESFQQTPVIIISASDDDECIRQGEELGARGHLAKPLRLRDFLWIVGSIQRYGRRLERLAASPTKGG